ncbi:MAG: hypothetical protein ABEN55_11380, partial [Bradymonadaceae bacterium]
LRVGNYRNGYYTTTPMGRDYVYDTFVGDQDGDRPDLWRLEAVAEIPFFAGSAETPATDFPDPQRVFDRLTRLMTVTDAIEAEFGEEHGKAGLDIPSRRVAEAFDGGSSDE